MAKPNFPDAASRRKCWGARDEYFDCLTKNTDDESQCANLKKAFESSCPNTWVKHFVRRRDYLQYKDKLGTEGFVPAGEKQKS
ncbi:cytochrome c oxidase assembly factor 6 homolog [Amphiura filiformis]|uniref:cytochrome c oxidase assembly factor 6 homolog n=1 Tax=Amphiura filiformis TaxID=82378 RepID=UPI003B2250E0